MHPCQKSRLYNYNIWPCTIFSIAKIFLNKTAEIYNNIAFQLRMLSKSNVTSISFTVEDDLISESSLNSTRKTAFHGLKPFSKKYGLNDQQFDSRPLPNKANRQIMQRAQIDAYRQMNEQLFNPFQHKLNNGFVARQSDLYQQQKMRQIQLLRKKEQQMMKSNNNYTIVFNNEKKSKHNLQMAGKNIIDGDVPNIADYYNKKFAKKSMEHIDEENDENEQDKEQEKKKVNNFISSTKKSDKSIDQPAHKQLKKTDSSNSKRNKQPTSIKSIQYNENKKKETQKKKSEAQSENLKNETSAENLKQTMNKLNQIKSQTNVQRKEENRPAFNLHPSIKNNEVKKQQPKKAAKKPPIPKFNSNSNPNTNPKAQGNQKKKYSEAYDGPDRNLVQQLERQLTQCPTISFDDIAELEVAKNLLQEAVLLPRLMPQFFQGIRKAMRGILLFGPPGTGKTLLAKAIAKDNIFFNVSASSLASKWKGQSQKMVRILFEMAKYHSPSVIFFDQIDCIGSKRSENEHESARKVKTELLVQMDGVGSTQNEVFVLAATNRPWDLDEALRRRLEKRIYIPLPGIEGRKKMFDINLKGLKVSQKVNWEKLIQLTKGCSGADICNVCRDAAYMPMRRKITQLGGISKLQDLKQTELIEEQVLQNDLIEAAKKVKPSVGKDDLKRYEAWMAEFGSS